MHYSSNRRKKGSSRPTSSNSFPPHQGAILHSKNDTEMKGWQCKIAQQNHNRPPCPPPGKTRAAAGGVSRSEVAVKITKLQLPESTRHPSAGKCLLRLKSYLVLPTRGALPYVLSLEAASVARGIDKVDRRRTKSQSKQIANKSVAATEPQANGKWSRERMPYKGQVGRLIRKHQKGLSSAHSANIYQPINVPPKLPVGATPTRAGCDKIEQLVWKQLMKHRPFIIVRRDRRVPQPTIH
jgi:hypothetical protein